MTLRFRLCSVLVALAIQPVAGMAATATPRLSQPELFASLAPAASANDGSPTFSPDGKTLLFARSGSTWSTIMESNNVDGRWSAPRIAPFSGTWSDWAPEFSPDGRWVIFVEVRPDTHANLWRVERQADGWSSPTRLPDAINIGRSVWKPSIAADGSVYFVSIDPKGHKRLFVSHFERGAYQPAQPLPFSDGSKGDVDPEVAPDESFVVFASSGRVPGDAKDHLFIAFRTGGTWGMPMRLRYAGDDANGTSTDNEPHLGPDHRTLYFSSDRFMSVHFPRTPAQAELDVADMRKYGNGSQNAWFVSLAPVLGGS